EVDVVGAQSPQRSLDLHSNARGRRIAPHPSVAPFEPRLGRNDGALAQALRKRQADDLFRTPESVDGCRIDQPDPALHSRANRTDRLVDVGATPHPAANGPRAQRDTRRNDPGGSNLNRFHGFIAPGCSWDVLPGAMKPWKRFRLEPPGSFLRVS